MPLGLTMHGKWDGISMATSPLHTYKHERPAYSTPQPVENTPANNECRMVDLRGAKVASFFVGGDEFICLPQAFDLFLKHLVGGLHTVYTKLKRLSISPVVCNVEQVRILRGLGAIQPGVNRCKLITRKDFETLYQDCTQASRPGRPPKRYPMLPPTTDLMSQHPGIRSLGNAHGLLTASDISNLHKRMRLEQDVEKHLHQQERRISGSPPKDNPVLPGKDLTLSGGNEIHSNATNLYLQAQQALRQQYQQVASTSLHNGLDNPHSAVAAAGMNPALAPLMMMSHPALFTGAIPPSMLNHINQFAQNHANGNAVSNAAAVAAAQIAANGGNMHQQAAAAYQVAAAAQSAAHASLVAARASRSNSPQEESGSTSASLKEERVSDNHERTPKTNDNVSHNSASLMNGFGSEGRISPASSISSHIEDENMSNGSLSANSDSRDSMKFVEENDDDLRRESPSFVTKLGNNSTIQQNQENQSNADDTLENNEGADDNGEQFINADISQVLAGQGNISSMQTLLTNIQGLLKVAADNAKLQDKHSSFEIADLKNRINNEKQKRGSTEKKLQESERIRALMQRRLKKERKVRKLLQEQLLKMQQKIDNEEESEQQNKIAAAPSMPIRGVFGLGRESVIPPSTSPPPYTQQSPQTVSPGCEKDMSPSSNENISISGTTLLTAASSGGSSLITAVTSYPSSRECGTFSSSLSTISSSNNNNNNTASFVKYTRKSPSPTRTGERRLSSDQDLDMNEIQFKKHLPVQPTIPSSHLFFKTAHFQTTMSQ